MENTQNIKVKSTIISFTKVNLPWGSLGNLAPYPSSFQGQMWRTSEALFQALRFDDLEIRSIIQLEKSPMGAKFKAKSFRKKMTVEPMSAVDVNNMKMVLKLKFDTHLEIRKKLILSNKNVIVEDIGKRNGERHLFWGMKEVDGQWIGNNTMGKLLMELRDSYKNSYSK